MRFKELTLALLLLLPSAAIGAGPVISGGAGIIQADSTFTVYVTGAGYKENAGPLLWDTISNQAAYSGLSDGDPVPTRQSDNCPDCPWYNKSVESGDLDIESTPGDLRVAGRPIYRITTKADLKAADPGDNVYDVMYVNWWFRNGTPVGGTGTLVSGKFLRMWASAATHHPGTDSYYEGANSFVHAYVSVMSDLDHDCTWDRYGDVVSYADWQFQRPESSNEWWHFESISDSRGLYDCGYGRWIITNNNRLLHDVNYWSEFTVDYLGLIGFDPSQIPASYVGAHFDMSEIYVDSTMARVAIADADTWSNVRHYELQQCTDWDGPGGSITFTVNAGTFVADDLVYLYVINADNEPSNGLGLVVEGEPIIAPPGPPGQPVYVGAVEN